MDLKGLHGFQILVYGTVFGTTCGTTFWCGVWGSGVSLTWSFCIGQICCEAFFVKMNPWLEYLLSLELFVP